MATSTTLLEIDINVLRKLPTDQHTQSYLVDLETEDNGKWHTDSLGVSRFIVIRMRRKKSQPSLPAVPKDDAEEARLEKKWFQSNIGTREKTSKRLTQSQSSRLTKKRGDSTELTASTSVSTRVSKRVANQDLQEPAKKGGLVGWQAPIKKMARSQKWEKQRVLHHLGLVQPSWHEALYSPMIVAVGLGPLPRSDNPSQVVQLL